jgi:hypothetical protein
MNGPRVDDLDPGIRQAVLLLVEAGIKTYESCDATEGHSYTEPTIKFYGAISDGWRALAVCKDHGLPVRNLERCWDLEDGEPAGPYWKLVFRRGV